MAEGPVVQRSRLLDLPAELLDQIPMIVGQPALSDLSPADLVVGFVPGTRKPKISPNPADTGETPKQRRLAGPRPVGPTEMDCIIAKKSLRSLRLTCRACDQAATQWLFASGTVHARETTMTLRRLAFITGGRLAKYLRHIILVSDGTGFQDFSLLQEILQKASHLQSLTIKTRMDIFTTQMNRTDDLLGSFRRHEGRIADAVSLMTSDMLRTIKLSVHDSAFAGRLFSYGRPDGGGYGAQWVRMFGQVRSLDVVIYKRQYRPSEMWRGRREGELLLVHPLSLMPNLEHLRLNLFALTGAGVSEVPDQPRVPPTVVLSELRTLDLGRCTISAWILVTIFTKSLRSLTKVSLREIPLTGGSWEEALEALSGSSSLMQTDFAGLHYSEVTEDNYQYPGGAFGGDGIFYEPIQQADVKACRDVLLCVCQNRKRRGLPIAHSEVVEYWLKRAPS